MKHLYKAAAPTAEHLIDEKYLQFIQDAVDLYGLIHSRFIKTTDGKSAFNFNFFLNLCFFKLGCAKIVSKYIEGVFGFCPRALCNNQKCLPVGLSDKLRSSRVKIFCPKCDEVYMV
jgi:casein kinase II subunit beta